MSSSSSPFEPAPPRHEGVPPLSSSTREGEAYQRHADVEAEIARALARRRADWMAMCQGQGRLSNEAIVFLARQTLKDDRDLCGRLIHQLGRAVARIAGRWAQGFDPLTTDEIVWQVETEIIELVLAPTPSRQSEFLEMAFGKAVERRTINAVEKRRHSPMPLGVSRSDSSDDEPDAERQAERVADKSPDPEQIAAQLEDEIRRRELIKRAYASVKDPRHLEAVILRHVRGWPITDKDPTKPTLVKHFGKSERQIRNWINEGLEAMRAAIGETK